MQQSRQTAFKLWLHDIKNSKYFREEGEFSPNYVLFKDKKISRVNIIANVVMKFENPERSYSSITLDDGSNNIRVKCWREDIKILDDIDIGNTVMVIGRVREFNNEGYIIPEIVKNMDSNWALVRRLELEKLYGKLVNNSNVVKEEVAIYDNVEEELVEEIQIENNRQKILSLIEKFDSDSGADISDIVTSSNVEKDEARKIIEELLKEGEIFELKPGKLKLIN